MWQSAPGCWFATWPGLVGLAGYKGGIGGRRGKRRGGAGKCGNKPSPNTMQQLHLHPSHITAPGASSGSKRASVVARSVGVKADWRQKCKHCMCNCTLLLQCLSELMVLGRRQGAGSA